MRYGIVGITICKNSSDALTLISRARSGLALAFRKSEQTLGYSSEKSDCETCIVPRTVMSHAGQGWASSTRFDTRSKLDGQYVKASELIARIGA